MATVVVRRDVRRHPVDVLAFETREHRETLQLLEYPLDRNWVVVQVPARELGDPEACNALHYPAIGKSSDLSKQCPRPIKCRGGNGGEDGASRRLRNGNYEVAIAIRRTALHDIVHLGKMRVLGYVGPKRLGPLRSGELARKVSSEERDLRSFIPLGDGWAFRLLHLGGRGELDLRSHRVGCEGRRRISSGRGRGNDCRNGRWGSRRRSRRRMCALLAFGRSASSALAAPRLRAGRRTGR